MEENKTLSLVLPENWHFVRGDIGVSSANYLIKRDLFQSPCLLYIVLTIIIHSIFITWHGSIVTGQIFCCSFLEDRHWQHILDEGSESPLSCRPDMELSSLEDSSSKNLCKLVINAPTISPVTRCSYAIILWKYSWSCSYLMFINIMQQWKYCSCWKRRQRPSLAPSNQMVNIMVLYFFLFLLRIILLFSFQRFNLI